MKRLSFAIMFGLVVSIVVPATTYALSLYSQGYSFNVRVTNKHYQSISDARGSVWISGNRAQIEVRAAGYRSQREYVYLRENQKYYSINVRLNDPTVFYRVRNGSHQSIPGAYARENNVGVWGNEFRFEIRLPAEGYSQFDEYDIDVDCTGGFVFGEQIRVYDLGTTRRVEITVRRRDMGEYSNTFTVVIPSDEELRGGYRRELLRKLNYALTTEAPELAEEQRTFVLERIERLKRSR